MAALSAAAVAASVAARQSSRNAACARLLLSTASLSRQFCTPPPAAPPNVAVCAGAGAAGGAIGGMIGLGGGAVMVPLMTGFARMTQHQAVGTSSVAVAAVGMAGCASFGSAGAVDPLAALSVAATAMFGARVGARLTARFDAVQLARASRLPAGSRADGAREGYLVRSAKGDGAPPPRPPPPAARRARRCAPSAALLSASALAQQAQERASELLLLAGIGIGCGLASGMFGIGGGVVVTPSLCLLTDMPYACVLGTTLTSMVPPSIVSGLTHARLGNVVSAAALPLCAGSATGAFVGGQLAVRVDEEPLQLLFAVLIGAMGAQKLWSLRGK